MKDGDTLSDLTRRFYSPDGDAQLHAAWQALYIYNKEAIGPDANQFRHGSGTMLCLLDRLSGRGWTLLRKGGGGALPPREAGPAPGVERKVDSKEEAAPEPAGGKGAQRMDVYHHLDKAPAAEGPSRVENASDSPPPRPNPLRRVVMGGMLGVMVPLSPALRDSLFREVGVALIDVRFTVGPVEIAPRAMFVGGRDSIVYNGVASPQAILVGGRHSLVYNNDTASPRTIVGGGGGVQLGVPLELAAGRLGTFRTTLGIQSGLLYVHRSIQHTDWPLEGKMESDSGPLPSAGAFSRVEHALPIAPGWKAALEIAGEALFVSIPGADMSENITINIFGGLGHAF